MCAWGPEILYFSSVGLLVVTYDTVKTIRSYRASIAKIGLALAFGQYNCYIENISANGTYLNGQQCRSNHQYLLQAGDVILLRRPRYEHHVINVRSTMIFDAVAFGA